MTRTACLLLGLALTGLALAGPAATAEPGDDPAGATILWVDSYHPGFEWSDGIGIGIREALNGTGVELEAFHMDTKRNPSRDDGREAGQRAFALFRHLKPDVVIASDDNAQKYFAEPYLRGAATPVVFCGVNWDASMYGYPAENVTGMIEVNLVEQAVDVMSQVTRGSRVGYLSGNVRTERKILKTYNERFFGGRLQPYLAGSFEEFKAKFRAAQGEVDMLLIGNYGGIQGWDRETARQFMTEHIAVPTACFDRYMAPFAVFTLGKVPEEQGRWAARTALRILEGASAADIPIVENRRADLIVNLAMADAAGIVVPRAVLKVADILGREPQ